MRKMNVCALLVGLLLVGCQAPSQPATDSYTVSAKAINSNGFPLMGTYKTDDKQGSLESYHFEEKRIVVSVSPAKGAKQESLFNTLAKGGNSTLAIGQDDSAQNGMTVVAYKKGDKGYDSRYGNAYFVIYNATIKPQQGTDSGWVISDNATPILIFDVTNNGESFTDNANVTYTKTK